MKSKEKRKKKMPPGRWRYGRRRLARAAKGNIDCGRVETKKACQPGRKFPPLHGPAGTAESIRSRTPTGSGPHSG
jgi:hypothetical protein